MSVRLPPMLPGFESQIRSHLWFVFVVGSRSCLEGFFIGFRVPPYTKTNTSKFQLDLETGGQIATVHVRLPIPIYLFDLFFAKS